MSFRLRNPPVLKKLPNPIRPAPADQVYVGNGDYSMTAPFFGVGVPTVKPSTDRPTTWSADGSMPA